LKQKTSPAGEAKELQPANFNKNPASKQLETKN